MWSQTDPPRTSLLNAAAAMKRRGKPSGKVPRWRQGDKGTSTRTGRTVTKLKRIPLVCQSTAVVACKGLALAHRGLSRGIAGLVHPTVRKRSTLRWACTLRGGDRSVWRSTGGSASGSASIAHSRARHRVRLLRTATSRSAHICLVQPRRNIEHVSSASELTKSNTLNIYEIPRPRACGPRVQIGHTFAVRR